VTPTPQERDAAVITGTVQGAHEAFDVGPALTEIARDRHIGLAESEQDFHTRVRDYLTRTRPDHSTGFADYLTKIAWSRHTATRLRLEITPAALRLLTQFADTLTDQPGAPELRTAVNRTAARAGWTTAPSPPEPTGK
jgi:hypothetical protein